MGIKFQLTQDQSADVFATADRHLYLDSTESLVVEEGDARSAFQFVAKGHPIAKADAERLGLTVDADGVIVLQRVDSEPVVAAVEGEIVSPSPIADDHHEDEG